MTHLVRVGVGNFRVITQTMDLGNTKFISQANFSQIPHFNRNNDQ